MTRGFREVLIQMFPELQETSNGLEMFIKDPKTQKSVRVIDIIGDDDDDDYMMTNMKLPIDEDRIGTNEGGSYKLEELIQKLSAIYPELIDIKSSYDAVDYKAEVVYLSELGFKDTGDGGGLIRDDSLGMNLGLHTGRVKFDNIYPYVCAIVTNSSETLLTSYSLSGLLDQLA